MNITDKTKEEENILTSIDVLFYKYIDRTNEDAFKTISRYYKYLSEAIEYEKIDISSHRELITVFESVALLLQERILLYPEAIKKQVNDIFSTNKLCDTMTALANIPENNLISLRLISRLGIFGKWVSLIFGRSFSLPIYELGINQESLFKAKIALMRLSQILKYAATIEMPDYDVDFFEMKDHYNPDLIQKPKIFALINILRLNVGKLPDREISERVFKRLDRLEEEIKKPRARWGIIFTGFLALLGFLADLDQLYPNIYIESYQTVVKIISVLYQDGSVNSAKSMKLLSENQDSEGVDREIQQLIDE